MERLCYLQRVVIILLILACVQNDDAKHTQANTGQNLQNGTRNRYKFECV